TVPNMRARFLREAQAMARIDHNNVIKVHEVGTHADSVYIAMEFVDGGTLRSWLEGAPRTWPEIVGVFAQAGRGRAAAHAAGLIHRDFKPENVLLTSSGAARVADFGLVSQEPDGPEPTRTASLPSEIASRVMPLSLSLTRTGSTLGTPPYMAPEQLDGEIATARSDQFAFCVALFEALYGQRPFGGDSVEELVANVHAGRVTVPTSASVPG